MNSRAGGTRLCRAATVDGRRAGPQRRARALTATVLATGLVLAGLATAGSAVAQSDPPSTTTTTAAPVTTTTTAPTATTTTTAPTTTTSGPAPTVPTDPTVPADPGTSTTTTPDDASAPVDPALMGLGELLPEERDLVERYLAIQRDAQDLATQLAMVDGSMAAAERDRDDAARRVAAADRSLKRTEDRLSRVLARLEEHRNRLRMRAVRAYIGGSHAMGGDRVALQAGSVGDLGKTLAYGAAVVDDERTLVERTAELHRDADALHAQAEADANEATAARDLVVTKQAALQEEHQRIVDAEGLLARNSEAKIALLSEAARRQVDIQASYAKTRALHDSIANTLAQRQNGEVLPLDMRGIFLSPIPHPRINSPFGPRVSPVLGSSSSHPGIDINARQGDPIRAPGDGEVIAAGWIDGYGNCTIIDHGSGIGTLYGHQSLIAVKVGDQVRRGQVIGFVGSTGFSTGPHLHWEVRLYGNPVNPAPFIGDVN